MVNAREISYRYEVRKTIRNVELGDGLLELLPMARMLYSYGCQVLWGHPGDGGQVIASREEEGVVAGELQGGQPAEEQGGGLRQEIIKQEINKISFENVYGHLMLNFMTAMNSYFLILNILLQKSTN